MVDRIEKSTSGNNQHCTTSSLILFSDPAATAEKEFELHHRTNLPKSVSKCQENCARPIKVEEVMVGDRMEELPGQTSRQEKKKQNLALCTYTHFHENCLKYFSETFYAPSQSFDFSKIKTDPKTHKKLTEAYKTLLLSLEIK